MVENVYLLLTDNLCKYWLICNDQRSHNQRLGSNYCKAVSSTAKSVMRFDALWDIFASFSSLDSDILHW